MMPDPPVERPRAPAPQQARREWGLRGLLGLSGQTSAGGYQQQRKPRRTACSR